MEVRTLRYFLAVVDEASLTRAAAVVRVAQPSLSRQIRGLETTLGRSLFDRAGGRLRLTSAGRQLVPLARDVVARADAAEAAMRDPEAARVTNLSVVAPHVTIVDVIAPYLATLGTEALKVSVRDAPSLAVFRILRSGDADLGVSVGPPPGELVSLPVARFSITAQVPPHHRWANRTGLTLEEVTREPLVLLTTEHGTRRVFDQAVAAAGLAYHAVGESNLSAVAQTLSAGGAGVAIVSDDARYGLHPLTIDAGGTVLAIPIVAAWEGSHYAAPMIEAWATGLAAYTMAHYGPDMAGGLETPTVVRHPGVTRPNAAHPGPAARG